MFRGGKVLGLVPARGGSKRLPGKNLAVLLGQPLLRWTLEAGKQSLYIDRVILSTDSAEIASVGKQVGFDDVLIRPASLAADYTSSFEVMRHVITHPTLKGEQFSYIALLQPTSPLRTAQHIDDAFQLIEKSGAIGAVSVCRTEHPMAWMGNIRADGFLDEFFKHAALQNQSQHNESYQINGAIYIVPIRELLDHLTVFLPNDMVAYVMKRSESVDIDEEFDLKLAEWCLMRREDGSNFN